MNCVGMWSSRCVSRIPSVLINLPIGTSTIMPKRHRYYWEGRPENKWRKLLMQVTLPRLERSPDFQLPKNTEDDDQLYGLDVVLFREAQQILKEHDMIIVYLKAQMEETDFYTMRHTLRKEGIDVEEFPSHVMQCALKGTHFENLQHLYNNDTLTVFSKEPKVKEMIQITKKYPYITLMGGYLGSSFKTAQEVVDCGNLPALQHSQSQFSSSISLNLASPSSTLLQNLSILTMYLGNYSKTQ